MAESLASLKWQETVDTAVTRLEAKTGLVLAGLSQFEISAQVREWMKAKAQEKPIGRTITSPPSTQVPTRLLVAPSP